MTLCYEDLDFRHYIGYGCFYARTQVAGRWGVHVVRRPNGQYEVGVLRNDRLHWENRVSDGKLRYATSADEVQEIIDEIAAMATEEGR